MLLYNLHCGNGLSVLICFGVGAAIGLSGVPFLAAFFFAAFSLIWSRSCLLSKGLIRAAKITPFKIIPAVGEDDFNE